MAVNGAQKEPEIMSSVGMSPEEIIRTLMTAAVPERTQEIHDLWARYRPRVSVVQDKRGITLDATRDRIEFDPKTMEVFWLIGFAGWRAIECYSPHVILSGALAKSLNDLFAGDVELPEVEIAYRERLAAARSLIEQRDANAVRWPDDVPRPVLDRDVLDGDQNKAAYDLIVLATAFAFFHEFRHVMLDRDQVRPIERQEEELQCDVWAREFMTAKLARFAGDCGHEYQTVLGKRSMGLALAALILHEITPKNAASPHYFSIKTRLTTLLRNTQLPDEHSFWTFMACLLVGIFRREHHAQVIPPLPVRHLAEELLAQLPE